ncbi:hypothetical protein [Reyranella sp.]|jgi:hypothetical protein|uniref:hypothetical protein n=1 Tax=Reyranella sp. TaxID=1929291 RepID=UPI002630E338|nr:hypothetical protein [Reyranella sp.]HQS18795.1 hypothetical protein [Reyranella sp.]HQT14895.1 hypothetical protein [Reyranella sp.]
MSRAKRKRKERAERLHREPIVRRVAELLMTGSPTPWRWTSEARHGLRAGLCLNGMGWHEADARAEEIVRLARHRIGLSRCPTWTEAQGDLPEEREYWYCSSCGGHMPEGSDRPWCSSNCHAVQLERRYEADRRDGDMARRQSIRAIFSNGLPEQPKYMDPRTRLCRHCRKPFTAKRADRSYCSNSCVSSARRLDIRDCLFCATPFTAKVGAQKYCSQACSYEASLRAPRQHPLSGERPCGVCGEVFVPPSNCRRQLYCQPSCRRVSRNRSQRDYQQRLSEQRPETMPMAEAA